MDRARVLVRKHQPLMGALAAELLEDETVSGDRLVQLAAAEQPSSVLAELALAEV